LRVTAEEWSFGFVKCATGSVIILHHPPLTTELHNSTILNSLRTTFFQSMEVVLRWCAGALASDPMVISGVLVGLALAYIVYRADRATPPSRPNHQGTSLGSDAGRGSDVKSAPDGSELGSGVTMYPDAAWWWRGCTTTLNGAHLRQLDLPALAAQSASFKILQTGDTGEPGENESERELLCFPANTHGVCVEFDRTSDWADPLSTLGTSDVDALVRCGTRDYTWRGDSPCLAILSAATPIDSLRLIARWRSLTLRTIHIALSHPTS
jgi:hypothetical protein